MMEEQIALKFFGYEKKTWQDVVGAKTSLQSVCWGIYSGPKSL